MLPGIPRIWPGSRAESADDYASVLVPLEEAHLYSHSARTGHCEYEEIPDDESHAGDLGVAKNH